MPWVHLVDPIRRRCGLHGPLIMFILENISLLFINPSVWLRILGYLCDRRGLRCLAHSIQFLSAFAESRKATVSFVISVCQSLCPSVRMFELGHHWNDFHETWYLNIFRKFVLKIQVSLKYDKNDWHFTLQTIYGLCHISLSSS
jgi:hypothetical protein